MIPLSSPDIGQAEIEAVVAVLRSGRLSLGEKLEEFESAFASYLGSPHAVAASSGTAALHLAIRALGIGEGDEVILPSFAFIAVAHALRYERAIPVFAEIEPHTLNVDPARLEELITPRTRAILAVHTFGVPAAMDEILELARRHGLLLIEDACEALGAEVGGGKAGTIGDAGVFAFYPNKQITCAEGGMVVTRDPRMAARMRALRNQGRPASRGRVAHEEIGFNYRLSELHCALGIVQLGRIEAILRRREAVAREYAARLKDLAGIELPPGELPSGRLSWFVYVVRLADFCAPTERDRISARLSERGIESGRYFAPIHLEPAYQKAFPPRVPLPVTESVACRTLALPFFNRIRNSELDRVCAALRESFEEAGCERRASPGGAL